MGNRPRFPGQHPDEEVVFILRRHWFILMTWLAPVGVLFFVTVGVSFAIGLALPLPVPAWAALILLLSIVPLGLVIWRFLDWENDHYILTNERVLHIERVYFLFERREEANLDKIQDVTVKMPTLTSNLLYFGDVEIQTAGTTGLIRFKSVDKPRKVQRLIFKEAGLPEPGTRESEKWRPSRMRFMRPLATLTRMLFAVVPQGGDVVVWRKHWFVLLTRAIRPALAAILLLAVWAIVVRRFTPDSLAFSPDLLMAVIPGIVFLVVVGWIAWITIDWHNDVYVLTDTHVIDIEKRPFTSEFRREANLGMIQNVSYEQPTFLSKLLDFGNTRLETAGTMGEFTFDSISSPGQVQEVISRRLADFRKRNAAGKPRPAPKTEEELAKVVARILSEQYGMTPPQPPQS